MFSVKDNFESDLMNFKKLRARDRSDYDVLLNKHD